jgi:ABC-type phosphate/phosphonate transport system substrate-binding protein
MSASSWQWRCFSDTQLASGHKNLNLVARGGARLFAVLAALGACQVLGMHSAAAGDEQPSIRIGIVQSLFRDVPKALVGAGREPFRILMENATGLKSEVRSPMPADELANRLEKGELQLAVFQGVEFAWEQEKHPGLRALLIAVNRSRNRKAEVIVRCDSPVRGWADLRGKEVAVPSRSREHVWLFFERQCEANAKPPEEFLARVTRAPTVEDALDDVVDGVITAATVDRVGLDAYQRRKPGRYARLRVLGTSEDFPDTVVAYQAGAIKRDVLRRCRIGLLKADKTTTGQLLLTLWIITHFEQVPVDFQETLLRIRALYPARLEQLLVKAAQGASSAQSNTIEAPARPGASRVRN